MNMVDYSTEPRASSSMRRVSSTGLNPPSDPAPAWGAAVVDVANEEEEEDEIEENGDGA